ncbi:MAG TPA: hypothetical protein VLV15_12960, partial [Dongiaceae bacterium]|nr:hypothetical protein [Dongiaceae bacterium]
PARTSFTIPASSSDTLGVLFAPTGPGGLADTLAIASNASNGPVTLVPLTGIAIDTLSIDVVSPDGGEEWAYHTAQLVAWTTSPNVSTVALEYQTEPAGVWKMIAPSLPANSSPYPWSVPFDTTSQARVRVRETAGNRFVTSAGVFKITAPILLEYPSPLDIWLQLVGLVRADSLRLENAGGAQITLYTVSSDNPHFWVGRPAAFIAPYSRDTIGVFFRPAAEGRDSATITITTNDPYGTRNIKVRGIGTTNLEVGTQTPTAFALSPNRPNPFRGETEIRYALPQHVHVSLDVFNLQGERVATLVHGEQGPGEFAVAFAPGKLSAPSGQRVGMLPAGVYFLRLQAGS